MSPEPPDETPTEHRDDGLDLARQQSRSTSGTTPARRTRRRGIEARRTPSGRWGSGAHPDERDPQPLELTVSRVVDAGGWDLDLRMAGVFSRWPELVGDEIGAHATPESFAEGRLVVRTDSTAWATQLKLLAATVVRRLNEELGHDTVRVIEIVGPLGPSWKKGPRSVRDGRGPRDTYG